MHNKINNLFKPIFSTFLMLTLALSLWPTSFAQAASITITAPTSGTCLQINQIYNVTWQGSGYTHVAIYLTNTTTTAPNFGSWEDHTPDNATNSEIVVQNYYTPGQYLLWVEGHSSTDQVVTRHSVPVSVATSCGTASADTQPPTVPTGLVGTALSTTSVKLDWAASTDNSGSVRYIVYTGNSAYQIVNQNSFTDQYLTANTNYTYTVVAIDNAGNRSASSSPVTVKTLSSTADTTPPTQPGTPTGTALSPSDIKIYWSASTDNSGTVGYKVMRGNVVAGTTSLLYFTDSNLSADTNYSYTVIAVDPSGNPSSPSSPITIKTQPPTSTTPTGGDTTPPTPPTGLAYTQLSTTSAKITWTAGTDNVGVTGYKVYQGTTYLGLTSNTNYTVSNLVAGTASNFFIQSVDAVGNASINSTVLTISLTANTPNTASPTAPSNLVATLVSGTTGVVKLTWQDNSNNETKFDIYHKGPSSTSTILTFLNTVPVDIVEYTHSGADAGINQYYVKACISDICSAPSSTISITVPPAGDTTPPVVSGVSSSLQSGTEAYITWTVNEPATGKVAYGTSSGQLSLFGTTPCSSSTVNTTTACIKLSNLGSSKTYFYRVVATDTAGNNGYSSESSFTTPAGTATPTIPATPTGITAQIDTTGTSVNIFWQDNSNNETQFKISRRNQGVSSWTQIGSVGYNTERFTNTSVPSGSYEYSVSACNTVGCSALVVSPVVTLSVPQSVLHKLYGSVKLNGTAVTDGIVDADNGNGLLVSVPVSSSGVYELNLPSGTYAVSARPTANSNWLKSSPITVTLSGSTATQNFKDLSVGAVSQTLTVILKDNKGLAVPVAGVVVIGGECGQVSNTSTSLSKSVDANGQAVFSLPDGSYCVKAGAPITSNLQNPLPKTVVISIGQNKSETFTFVPIVSSGAFTGEVVYQDGTVAGDAYISAASDTGVVIQNRTDASGKVNLPLISGNWKVSAKKLKDNVGYASTEFRFNFPAVTTAKLVLVSIASVPPQVTQTGSSTSNVVATATDGASVTLPASSVGTTGNLNLNIKPTLDTPIPPTEKIASKTGYEITVTDSTGQNISTLNKEAEILIPYDDAYLTANNLTPEKVQPRFWDTKTGIWTPVTAFTIDKTRKVYVVKISHFTLFALVSAADTTPPAVPTSVAITSSTGSGVKLTWVDPKADFHHSKIYRSDKSTDNGSIIAALVTGGTYTDTTAINGTTYYYRIQSVDASGNESSLSSPASTKVGSSELIPQPIGGGHAVGTNVKDTSGTIYMISSDGSKRPYTSAGAFLSYGFNNFKDVVDANSADLSMRTGEFIPPQDGKIICSDRGVDKGTCYLITGGRKAGFTSSTVFTKLGFSFKRSSSGDVSWMSSYSNIDDATKAHRPGVLVNDNGTVFMMGWEKRIGFPSMDVFNSWGYNLLDVVPANAADKSAVQSGVVPGRNPGELSPVIN